LSAIRETSTALNRVGIYAVGWTFLSDCDGQECPSYSTNLSAVHFVLQGAFMYGRPIQFLLALIVGFGGVLSGAWGQEVRLQGSGAAFPAQLYERWFEDLGKGSPKIAIAYQVTSSENGIKQLLANKVDFAGTDFAMSDAQIAAVKGGVVLVPLT